jgi:hypothetical protein
MSPYHIPLDLFFQIIHSVQLNTQPELTVTVMLRIWDEAGHETGEQRLKFSVVSETLNLTKKKRASSHCLFSVSQLISAYSSEEAKSILLLNKEFSSQRIISLANHVYCANTFQEAFPNESASNKQPNGTNQEVPWDWQRAESERQLSVLEEARSSFLSYGLL